MVFPIHGARSRGPTRSQTKDIHQAFAELGLAPQANEAQARAAYRALAMRWHPDLHAGADNEARMKAINVAYAQISQHLRSASMRTASPQPDAGFAEFDWKAGFRRAHSAQQTNHDVAVHRCIQVSLLEAALGCVKRVHGVQGTSQPGGFRGDCAAWSVDVPIHAGTCDGMQVDVRDIRVRSGAQVLPRRLHFSIAIEPHPLFKLHQDRLSVVVPVSVWHWALGAELAVPTLQGSRRIRLPSKPGAIMLKQQGWPEYRNPGQRKPLFVLPKIIYPEQLSAAERQLLQDLEAHSPLAEVQDWQRSLRAWVEAASPR